ncbi:hypothetical protein FGSG_13679 [Fusarium graminearum PH-1]|uniref:hypothetical protein n=1 Tax=Gibberella zeae (strain ATCC MYA-4620 / CBS 123657 / FGSC 9075 / NRRL 31084 / PH-1) TaxID=229533 RepID=UPI00021F1D76|nr:hypothetical protein FGSG_13679 [Fusarium graminearum PH-1]ESU16643.1 hypothetical protein FGSG_13679 [Fusarium graminearum PH-1]|eukprot:XP_011318905.1 hypothetical protein FGSG_13679 [Fusarium graminearum PH-1]
MARLMIDVAFLESGQSTLPNPLIVALSMPKWQIFKSQSQSQSVTSGLGLLSQQPSPRYRTACHTLFTSSAGTFKGTCVVVIAESPVWVCTASNDTQSLPQALQFASLCAKIIHLEYMS